MLLKGDLCRELIIALHSTMTCRGMGLEVESGSTSREDILREVKGVEDNAETRSRDSAYEL